MTEEAKGTRYLVLQKEGSVYAIAGTETRSGPVVAAKALDGGDGGSYLVVAESSAHFVDLEEYTPPSTLRATTRTVDQVLGQTTIEDALGTESAEECSKKVEDAA